MNMLKDAKGILASAAVVLGLAVSGQVAATPLQVDFRDSAVWGSAYGLGSYAANGVTVTATPEGSTLYRDDLDGFGVLRGPCSRSANADEIAGCEGITVDLTGLLDGSNYVTGILITDLFTGPIWNDPTGDDIGERGRAILNFADVGPTVVDFTGVCGLAACNGEFWVDLTGIDHELLRTMTSINFLVHPDYAAVLYPGTQNPAHDFSVAGLTVVPEPSAIALLGLGLVGFAAARRRR